MKQLLIIRIPHLTIAILFSMLSFVSGILVHSYLTKDIYNQGVLSMNKQAELSLTNHKIVKVSDDTFIYINPRYKFRLIFPNLNAFIHVKELDPVENINLYEQQCHVKECGGGPLPHARIEINFTYFNNYDNLFIDIYSKEIANTSLKGHKEMYSKKVNDFIIRKSKHSGGLIYEIYGETLPYYYYINYNNMPLDESIIEEIVTSFQKYSL